MKKFILALTFLASISYAHSQAGISVSPGRLYYKLAAGATGSQSATVTNPTDRDVEIGVSFSDWEYETSGNNTLAPANTLPTSCTNWIQIQPASYFVLKPGESKNVEVIFKVPANADASVPVHTGMIFFTQLNPGNTVDEKGASIQVTVRMGVKVYHSFVQQETPVLEFTDFTNYTDENQNKVIEVKIGNQGKIWADGKVKWELYNTSTGKKSTLYTSEFYTLPGDVRSLKQSLPTTLEKGNYTISAILNYGEDVIKIAELEFTL